MGLKKFALIIFLLAIAILPAFAQRDSIGLTTIVAKTEKLATEHPFEKVYLHFDKPYYAVGDTIWFKAYLTIGPIHQPSDLSSIIYVDVISPRDSIVKSLKLPTVNGVGFGDVTLSPKFFSEGNYHIRAYTNWMRNFGPDYFFNKTITIGDVYNNSGAPKISFTKTKKNKDLLINARLLFKNRDGNANAEKKVSWTVQNAGETMAKGKGTTDKSGAITINFPGGQLNASDEASLVTVIEPDDKNAVTNTFPLKSLFATTDVQFFPEGGELIRGVRSKVAFKAVNPGGLGVNVSGSVVDNLGNEVATFESQHAGMGIFPLLPDSDKTYKAIVTFPDGSKNTCDLPNVRPDGINLAVNNNDPDNLNIKVATNAVYFKEYRNKGFYIVAQSGGTICYTGLATLQGLVYTGSIPKSKFPTGVLQVTLFAANGEPLSERIVFIQHNDALDISLNTDLSAYKTRQLVKMTVTAKSKTLPVQGSFSVAVIDETKVPVEEDAETTILSCLLLTSDLRGFIEQPNYYFNHADAKKLADLDILMLTQGYRRFSYTNILADKYPPLTFLPEKGIDISGTLRTGTGMPVFRGNVNLRMPIKHLSENATTDANGQFKFSNIFLPDSTKVILTGKSISGNNDLMILPDAALFQPLAKSYNNTGEITNIDSALSIYLENSKKQRESSHVLKEVVIRSTAKPKIVHVSYGSLAGLSPVPDQVLGPETLKDCGIDFEGCVLPKVFGLWHVGNKYYIKRDYDKGNKTPLMVFVDGRAIDDYSVSQIRPADIASIEVYLKDGVSGTMRFYDCNGIISVTTKTNSFDPKDMQAVDVNTLISQSSSVTLMPKGFYKARMFYTPKYVNQESISEQGGDLRSTIHWEPNILTDKNGNASFDYYNADGKGSYRAVIEGIDSDGNIGRYVLRYQVR